MLDANAFLRLYTNVLNHEINIHQIPAAQIKAAIQSMARVYLPRSANFQSKTPLAANFNDVAYRSAYLHKYAPLHTYIVFDVMSKVMKHEMLLFRTVTMSKSFEVCCLGGGPGSDAIGVLAALHTEFSVLKSSVTVIDCMLEWSSTFRSILLELILGGYGSCFNRFGDLPWKYIETDLLSNFTHEARTSIATSSLVTMIKFLSAAACTNTNNMVEMIFKAMKPGALLLFIDNACGGFSELIERAAEENKFAILVGPLKHVKYAEETFNVIRFGYPSCCETTVTIFLLQKPVSQQGKRRFVSPNSGQNTNERTPPPHTQKKSKRSSRKYLQKSQVVLNPSDALLQGNICAKRRRRRKKKTSSQKPLQAIQNVPITPSPLPSNNKGSKCHIGNSQSLLPTPMQHPALRCISKKTENAKIKDPSKKNCQSSDLIKVRSWQNKRNIKTHEIDYRNSFQYSVHFPELNTSKLLEDRNVRKLEYSSSVQQAELGKWSKLDNSICKVSQEDSKASGFQDKYRNGYSFKVLTDSSLNTNSVSAGIDSNPVALPHSKLKISQENTVHQETSQPEFKIPSICQFPVREQNKSRINSQYSRITSLSAEKENKNQFYERFHQTEIVPNCSNRSQPMNNEDEFNNFHHSFEGRKYVRNYPSYSAITTQPVSSSQIIEDDQNEDSEEDTCCSCWG